MVLYDHYPPCLADVPDTAQRSRDCILRVLGVEGLKLSISLWKPDWPPPAYLISGCIFFS